MFIVLAEEKWIHEKIDTLNQETETFSFNLDKE
jgi:hypothetical protein